MEQSKIGEIIIELDSVTKTYPDGTVGISDLSLQIRKGEIFGFLGQNGAGKTTCIRCILNILIPDEGNLRVLGTEVSRDHPELKEKIGYLPGELNIPGYYKVKDFLYYIASLRTTPASRMDEIAELFELPLDKSVNELSKGNKQKIGLVIALMNDPEVLILDEPTSGLDPIFQQTLYDLLMKEKDRGKTIFFSSHNLDEVQRICDRVGVIREGELVAIETVRDLSDKISRSVTIVFDSLSEDIVNRISDSLDVIKINHTMGEIKVAANSLGEFSKIIKLLEDIPHIRDISYPAASLESYFMSKYREE